MARNQNHFGDLEGFESYTFQGRGEASPDFATLNKTGMLCFSLILQQKLGIEGWTNVLLAYNSKTQAFALKSCDAEEYGSRVFKAANTESHTKMVMVKGLVKFFKSETYRKYKPTKRGDNIVILTPVPGEAW